MSMHTESGGRDTLPRVEIDRTLSFRHPLTVEAHAYWTSLLKGRAMPSRADISPRAMRNFLADMALVEPRRKADGAPDYYVRLAGTRVEQLYGPVTGKLVSDFLTPEVEARWRETFDAAIGSGAPVRTIGRMAFQRRSWLEVESLIAPLSNDGKTVAMLLVVVAAWEAGKTPV